ncbi:MAG: FHA domain-containing protein, partial [Nostoc sp.]
ELLQPDALGISESTNSHPPSSSLPPTEMAVAPAAPSAPPAPPQVSVIESSPPEPVPTVPAQPVVFEKSIPTPPPLESAPASEAEVKEPAPASTAARTQLQQVTARLIH